MYYCTYLIHSGVDYPTITRTPCSTGETAEKIKYLVTYSAANAHNIAETR